MRDHRKLDVFKLADDLVMRVYDITLQFPPEELYGLASQMRRAAVSVGANIVEGAGRPSDKDFARFLSIAYSSASELEYELSIAHRRGYLSTEQYTAVNGQALETCRALYAFINAIDARGATPRR